MSENRLGRETSPYLLQHKDNPVHWWPWGTEALAEARRTGKPILLSVGYAACHWCHVMAHESFEDEATASVMNELFVNIKVDREERPDIDQIYMAALHALGQQGGWPMTMFLDADARPFWGGTYFPPRPHWGRPAFVDVLRQVARIYRDEPEKIALNGAALTDAVAAEPKPAKGFNLSDSSIARIAEKAAALLDPENGGIRGAPKFPQWSFFWFLWRAGIRYETPGAVDGVVRTLRSICQGGIYDHLGGGFSRYSVDERWLVPHFEKMLYDNALLIDLMTDVWRETRDPLFEIRTAETVAWLEREMIAEGGGFAASLDADSEGEEGKFYVWTDDEIRDTLGEADASRFRAVYDVAPGGNWEGKTILNRLSSRALGSGADEAHLADLRARLLARREERVRPGWDDKILADWNGLAIAALARSAQVFARPSWLERAKTAFSFVATRMTADGRLHHAARKGQISAPATAADYANMIWAALRLFEATLEAAYLDQARQWTEVLDRHYLLPGGGYATAADDTLDVIVRMRSAADEALPNANATMISNLSMLAQLTGEAAYSNRASETVEAFSGHLALNVFQHTGLLSAAIDAFAPTIAVLADGPDAVAGDRLMESIRSIALPGALEIRGSATRLTQSGAKGLFGKEANPGGIPVVHSCIGTLCAPPEPDPARLRDLLRSSRSAHWGTSPR